MTHPYCRDRYFISKN